MLTHYDKKWIEETIDEKLNNFCEELIDYIRDMYEVVNDYDDEEED